MAADSARQAWRALWREPRSDDAPVRVWRDWVLVGGFGLAAVLEGILNPDVTWRPVSIVMALGLLPTLLWRRTHPLLCLLVAFGTTVIVQVAAVLADRHEVGLGAMIFFLVLLYADVRWGSGREVVLGVAAVLGVATFSIVTEPMPAGDVAGAYAVLTLAVGAGATVRARADLDRRRRDQIRSEERVGLARDLHDVVAHHVSAIAVQAQAGRTVGARDAGAALRALEAIEDEASRTLAQMRTMVGVLRAGTAVDYAPLAGIASLRSLADPDGRPAVVVRLSGDASVLPPTVDNAVFRLAQEALTNARRHARDATRIDVEVAVDADRVRVHVHDDGAADPAWQPGYGIIGMSERAQLLGGTFSAGPSGRGWTVAAELPVEPAA
ncbi:MULTISPECIES: sensor histidine kinase [unclassified Nocardioides]|uniref:sensor histidine kinase n=1 Tax=unclassified Nocardioides TaxID=2615069 RepID=UPI0036071D79